MSYSNATLTDALPNIAERNFYLAPQVDWDTFATANAQSLRFTSFQTNRTQSLERSDEFGGNAGSPVDAADPFAGDVTAGANITTRLDLEETPFILNYLMGGPTSAVNVHSWNSGKSQLPVASGLFEHAGIVEDQLLGAMFRAMTLNFSANAGFQTVEFDVLARDVSKVANAVALAGFNPAPASDKDILYSDFDILINAVSVPRWLTGTLNYNTGLQAENYIGGSNIIDAAFVEEPEITGQIDLRYAGEAALAAVNDPETPFSLEFNAPLKADNQYGIVITLPRVFATRNDTPDGRRMTSQLSWRAARDGANPAMTVEITNAKSTAY